MMRANGRRVLKVLNSAGAPVHFEEIQLAELRVRRVVIRVRVDPVFERGDLWFERRGENGRNRRGHAIPINGVPGCGKSRGQKSAAEISIVVFWEEIDAVLKAVEPRPCLRLVHK